MIAVYVVIVLLLAAYLSKAKIYDLVITSMTSAWYKAALEKIPEGSRVLDVGIGTGKALLANKDLLLKRKLTVVGVDYDGAYVTRCKELVREAGLDNVVSVYEASIYDFMTAGSPTSKLAKFDCAYFSGSLMIMPDPKRALDHVQSLLNKPTGSIYITQTFESERPSAIVQFVKPLLKFVTTIDFGQATFEPQFLETVKAAQLKVKSVETIQPSSSLSSVTKGANANRRFKLYTLNKL